MKDEPNAKEIAYAARPDVTPESELNALVNVYCFILDCHAKKKGGPETAPEDAERRSNGIGADEASIPRQVD